MSLSGWKLGQHRLNIDNDQTINRRRLIFLDTETTGLNRIKDRICEVAAIEVNENLETIAQFHSYVNPQIPVPYYVRRIHGLTNDFLADKPIFANIAPSLARFLEGAELYAHNMSFDSGFLNSEFSRNGFGGLDSLDCSLHCTCVMAKRLLRSRSYSLDSLLDRFHIDRSSRVKHGALVDARLLLELYKKLVSIQAQFDQNR